MSIKNSFHYNNYKFLSGHDFSFGEDFSWFSQLLLRRLCCGKVYCDQTSTKLVRKTEENAAKLIWMINTYYSAGYLFCGRSFYWIKAIYTATERTLIRCHAQVQLCCSFLIVLSSLWFLHAFLLFFWFSHLFSSVERYWSYYILCTGDQHYIP